MVLRPCKCVAGWQKTPADLSSSEIAISYLQLSLEMEAISALLVRSVTRTDFRSVLVGTFVLEQEEYAGSKLQDCSA